MSSKLVKYCPLCGAANDPAEPFCAACRDGELLSVLPEPLRPGDALGGNAVPTAASAAQAIDWEADTPPQAAVKEHGPDTLHVEAGAGPAQLVLELVERPELRFTVADGQTVGASRDEQRRADVTLTGVPNLDYISSVHARFFKRGEQWFVQHSGSTNFIKVDGTKFEKREEVPLHQDSVVVLSKTPFRVLLGGEL